MLLKIIPSSVLKANTKLQVQCRGTETTESTLDEPSGGRTTQRPTPTTTPGDFPAYSTPKIAQEFPISAPPKVADEFPVYVRPEIADEFPVSIPPKVADEFPVYSRPEIANEFPVKPPPNPAIEQEFPITKPGIGICSN